MSIKFVAGLLIGAAAGAALVHFLNTEEGKRFTSKLKKDASKVEDELADLADDLIQKGKSFMNEMEEKVDEATS
jgi:gas vesicle protein